MTKRRIGANHEHRAALIAEGRAREREFITVSPSMKKGKTLLLKKKIEVKNAAFDKVKKGGRDELSSGGPCGKL